MSGFQLNQQSPSQMQPQVWLDTMFVIHNIRSDLPSSLDLWICTSEVLCSCWPHRRTFIVPTSSLWTWHWSKVRTSCSQSSIHIDVFCSHTWGSCRDDLQQDQETNYSWSSKKTTPLWQIGPNIQTRYAPQTHVSSYEYLRIRYGCHNYRFKTRNSRQLLIMLINVANYNLSK